MAMLSVVRQEDASTRTTPASAAGAAYGMLVWEVPLGLELDDADAREGAWRYPPATKFDRLLRHCRVPIGILSNGFDLRLMYAPHGESTGSLTFHIEDMASVGGRPLLDALVMLLHAQRFFGVEAHRTLPSILADSRRRQADVTSRLAQQVQGSVQVLLSGFAAAAGRDGWDQLEQAVAEDDTHIHQGLLTVMLRLVFLLYSEDRELLPVKDPVYGRNLSVYGLYHDLVQDHGTFHDTMDQRFGAWGRLIALFRAIFSGLHHHGLKMPARRGELFDPNTYPFLEGWAAGGSAPIDQSEEQAKVRLPSISDETVFLALQGLIIFEKQRLSYRALDVEQIGSIYEALMGYHVHRLDGPAVCLKGSRLWLTGGAVLAKAANERASWLRDEMGMDRKSAANLAADLKSCRTPEEVVERLKKSRAPHTQTAPRLALVLQPGKERRRTSSHYTPRSLTEPLVRRTLEPLLRALGEAPSSEQLLSLKICDPAMGSGAFLVAACRYLGDQVVAAWTREGDLKKIADAHEDATTHARRLVVQRCLYGVDRNATAVTLAKLSLWLVTLAKDLPFTFVDHALAHGDSLIGLSPAQICAFSWSDGAEEVPELKKLFDESMAECLPLRRAILQLAYRNGEIKQQEKRDLLSDANDALAGVKAVGDLALWSFFSADSEKGRQKNRDIMLRHILDWLRADAAEMPAQLRECLAEIRKRVAPLHWTLAFPEAFFRSTSLVILEQIDAFVGNPPFSGSTGINQMGVPHHRDWLGTVHPGAHGNSDYSAHFIRRCDDLIGRYGCYGLITTNTIAQGNTRTTGLQHVVRHYSVIYHAETDMAWPGEAGVTVSIVNVAKGMEGFLDEAKILNGVAVRFINSQLLHEGEAMELFRLAVNSGMSFKGSEVMGTGFFISPEERAELVSRNSKNEAVLRPFIGGEEVNTSPTQDFERYVVDFKNFSISEASKWPDILQIVRDRVKPERDKKNYQNLRDNWWIFKRTCADLYEAIEGLDRCLVISGVTKHLCFSFQPIGRIFSCKLFVFPLETYCDFAILQSKLHELWVLKHGSTMRRDISYTTSSVFDTFPFPGGKPGVQVPTLERVGDTYYQARAQYMGRANVGLTGTYNAMKDPGCEDKEILALRKLHEAMDRAVLKAYGWDDIEAPPYIAASPTERAVEAGFNAAVMERLSALNHELGSAKPAASPVPKGAGGRSKKKRPT